MSNRIREWMRMPLFWLLLVGVVIVIGLIVTVILLAGHVLRLTGAPPVSSATTTDNRVAVYDSDLGLLLLEPSEVLGKNPLRDVTCQVGDDLILLPETDQYDIIQGIDVSEWQNSINWNRVAADGIDFVIIRCGGRGYMDGILYTDKHFLENLNGAKAAGLDVGIYFFSQAINAEEGQEEAEYTLELLDGVELDLPIFFDWEATHEQARTTGISPKDLNDAAHAFLKTIGDGGYQPGLYFYKSLAYSMYDMERFADYPMWLAEYGAQDYFYGYEYLQYTDQGRVNGINVITDRNLRIRPKTDIS